MAEDIRDIVREMRKCQIAISDACAHQPDGWRQDVVRSRRVLADQLGRASECLSRMSRDTTAIIRGPLSDLRAALADHQASWPAVSLDPDVSDYRRSVGHVRSAFDRLETALDGLDRPGPSSANGDTG